MYEQYQLTVMCNVEETGTGSVHIRRWSTLQRFTICLVLIADLPAEPAVSSSGFKYLASSSLLQRRRIFRKRLVKITKDRHKVCVDTNMAALNVFHYYSIYFPGIFE